MTKNALLEIGTEEIPTSYLDPAREQLAAMAQQFLKDKGLPYGMVRTFATPRRLTVVIDKLEEKGQDRFEEAMGPAVKVGRDSQGHFTPAAKGFAARHGLEPEKLAVKMTEKGEYFCVRKKIPGEKSDTVLKELFPYLIGHLSFPKTMVWEPSRFRFARPIRTIMALSGDKIIKFAVAGVRSGNSTTALHAISRKKISVSSPERYLTILRNNCVLADPMERKEALKKAIEATARRARGKALSDGGLLEEVNYLVEHPVAVLGHYDAKYLELPAEVLVTCMRKKQKYFPVLNEQEKLTNAFIGVRNGISENQDVVREGYERVLTARLSDAEFFFHNDTRTPLAAKAEKLKGVVFQQKLGTVYDKMARVRRLAELINGMLAEPAPGVARTAELAKADLVTEMVFEYPELQGVVGRIYAEKDGEPAEVSRAIEEHYWPLSADGKLPETPTGTLVALADKLDTVLGYFAIGLIPSGSQDPYALRRLAAGVLRMLREKRLPLSLRKMAEASFSLLPEGVRGDAAAVDRTMDFLRQRAENLIEASGYRFDEVRAVLASGFDDIVDADLRIAAVKQIRQLPDFAPLAGAFKRAANILKQAEKMKLQVPGSVREDLLREEAERDLFGSLTRIQSDVAALLERREYPAVLQQMVSIKPKVDEFFDKVMVMAEDEALKANRLALLRSATGMFSRVMDFSLLQG